MAKQRYINTIFWRDDYISKLDPSEKLLYLYFLTNPDTNICGIYQIPLKIIAVDTGFDQDMIIKILCRFKKDNKIIYKDGWVAIRNFIKHQSLNPKIERGIEIELKKVPKELKNWIAYDSLSHTNTNTNTNRDRKLIPPTLEEIKIYKKQHNLNIDCELFLKYFTESNWIDSKGNKVKNWKQKMLTWSSHSKNEKRAKTTEELYG